ncbi:MAG: hypothetical protein KGO96_07325 [Elusimicrobia bacterium]|nr:hypothetical protein [Elusimicrobiota bacterium]
MDIQLRQASKLFYDIIVDNENRLRNSTKDRERIKQQIANNQKPTGYRAVWLFKSSMKIIVLLGELSKQFNETYPQDKISTMDRS